MEVINTIGRRKTSVARVYMSKGSGVITVNNKPLDVYFPTESQRAAVNAPFAVTETLGQFDVKVNVFGGGVSGQTGAISLAIARAIVKSDENLKSPLRKEGLVTRDPRMVERKKPGQKKARKKFQFSKR
jgi:small subunit ribosomal protein S9